MTVCSMNLTTTSRDRQKLEAINDIKAMDKQIDRQMDRKNLKQA